MFIRVRLGLNMGGSSYWLVQRYKCIPLCHDSKTGTQVQILPNATYLFVISDADLAVVDKNSWELVSKATTIIYKIVLT